MKRDLSKLYTLLTGEERFKLTLAAIARDDGGELEHLKNTCPRKDFSILDPACADRYDASQIIAMAFSIDWMRQERAYIIIRVGTELTVLAVRKFMDGYSMGIEAVINSDNSYLPFMAPSDEKLLTVARNELPEGYAKTLEAAKRELKEVLTAFEAFCREIDVPLEHILVWMPHVKEQVQRYRILLADVQPNNDAVQGYLDSYRKLWAIKTGQQFKDASTVA